eukprot:2912578-Lingulodinium_polyedra.AAC.1
MRGPTAGPLSCQAAVSGGGWLRLTTSSAGSLVAARSPTFRRPKWPGKALSAPSWPSGVRLGAGGRKRRAR